MKKSVDEKTKNIDPTANVIELVRTSISRLDDLRKADREIIEEKVTHTREMMRLRAEHQQELDIAEARRLDSNRNVDIQAVNLAYERAVGQATVLANQLAQTTDSLRNLVSQSSFALAERITVLEKSSYVGSGKSEVADPMLRKLVEEIQSLREGNRERRGKSEGASNLWGFVVGGIGALVGLIGLIALFIRIMTNAASTVIH